MKNDLNLARAGLVELTEEQVQNVTVCPAHRFPLRKYLLAPCDLPVSKTSWQEDDGDDMYSYFLFAAIHHLYRPRFSLSDLVAQSTE